MHRCFVGQASMRPNQQSWRITPSGLKGFLEFSFNKEAPDISTNVEYIIAEVVVSWFMGKGLACLSGIVMCTETIRLVWKQDVGVNLLHLKTKFMTMALLAS